MKLKTTAFGSSHAKIILFGEHSVVYDQPAIALPLYSVNTTVTLTATNTPPSVTSNYYNGPLADLDNNLLGIKELINYLLDYFNAPTLQFNLNVHSTIPLERGMGSSAAIATAITRAFFDYFNQPIDRATLLQIANVEEQITHGSPSGIDLATVSSEKPIWFIKNQENQQIDFKITNSYLVIADTGIKGKTSAAVNLVKQKLANSESHRQSIEQLGQIAFQARTSLAKTTDVKVIGELMNQAQGHLQSLGVSHPIIEQFCTLARLNGALGAKLTGSGLGGCVIALTDNLQTAQIIKNNLNAIGATETWIQSFANYDNQLEEHLE